MTNTSLHMHSPVVILLPLRMIMGLSTFVLLAILGLPLLAIIYIAFKVRKNCLFFKKNGIPYTSYPIVGILKIIFGKSNNLATGEDELYSYLLSTTSPYVGMIDVGGNQTFLITDLNLIRSIMVKDFDHFMNRRAFGSKTSDKFLSKMLTFMENDSWRHTRTKLSPTFTTTKIRRYFAIFDNSSKRMDAYIKQYINYPTSQSRDVDLKQIFPKYALDVIANCAFGIDSKSFEVPPEETSTFELMSQRFGFHFNIKFLLRMIFISAAPKLADIFKVRLMDGEAQDYYVNVVRNVLNHRRQSGERREDFLQMLMDLQSGLLKLDEESAKVMMGDEIGSKNLDGGSESLVLDDDDIIANGMMFLSAGFDTTQSLWLLVVYCLALDQNVQEKLYQEVTSVLNKYDGQVTYEAISEMSYLDMVVNETLRLNSPSTRTERVCTTNYRIPETDIVIEKGTIIIIPMRGIMRDARYYPDPEKFIPERFSAEGKANRNPYAFLPFGHGPRNCIGMRFALMKVKASLVQIVKSFHLEPCSKTQIPLQFGNDALLKPKDGLFLKMTVRNE